MNKKRLLSLLLALLMAIYVLPVSAESMSDFETAYEGVLEYLQNEVTPTVGSTGGEWAVFALARAGVIDNQSDWAKVYLAALDSALENEELIGSTDYERVALAVTALGIDAEYYNGQDLTEIYKTYNGRLGVNSKTFALLSLCSKPYYGDTDTYVQALIDAALSGGGWSLHTNGDADVDVSAMAIQALAPYYEMDAEVREVVDSGLDWIRGKRDEESGGFVGMEERVSTCSTAQVIVALTALGIDPTGDEWTTDDGRSMLDAMLDHYNIEGGYFGEFDDLTPDQMATEQATYALVAYQRFLCGGTSLYDMSDIDVSPYEKDEDSSSSEEDEDNSVGGGSPGTDADSDITVYFTLLGDEKHNSDEDGIAHTLKSNDLQIWISETEVSVPGNSSVIDVFATILEDNGYSWINGNKKNDTAGNYIQSITTPEGLKLGEFTNGELSGWMYTINGAYSDLGVSEQLLDVGDVIIFHYTDDYTQERDSEKWQPGSSSENDSEELYYADEFIAIDTTAIKTMADETADYIYKTVPTPQVGSIGGEWVILGLARSGLDIPAQYFENYYRALENYARDCKGILHEKKYTEYSRVVIALTAIGMNPTNVAGYDILTPLGDFNNTVWQGVNGPAWALIALDSGSYKMPENSAAEIQATRGMYVDYILEKQLDDGGWSLSGEASDVDVTAMVLQALSRYRSYRNVSAAIEKALDRMSDMQNETGGFSSWNSENSESCVQMIVALAELGIPFDDPRFVKNGNTVLDGLETYYVPGGGFKHTHNDSSSNQMATEQALYALVAAERFLDGKNSLYSMSDVVPISVSEEAQIIGLPGKNPDVQKMDIAAAGKTFADIQGHSYQSAIEALAARNIINGKSETVFDPDSTMTRAEFASIITRGLGLPVKAGAVFADVTADDWYFDYVNTAYNYGIIEGISETMFNPNGIITREEAAVMTARAAKLCGMDTEVTSFQARDILAGFSDYVKASDWAVSSLAFCYDEGILSDEVMEIKPKEAITRAEIAYMLYNMLSFAKLL